jgi:hypothetical protein
VAGGQLPPLELRRDTTSLVGAPVLVALGPPLPPVLLASVAAPRVFDRSRLPREGPSIFVLKQAFLI